ncbi:DUF3825 domain-containing protein [Pseudomonas aeruginosa]|uniref:DUF3825 domain-containing protein n=4 Tax=Pseudomonas aeruginosa TaxID=287 RepID=UPI000F523889|nr:DUF3825 domain-containing protein [Pseudomonas aeruginosa]MBG5751929.1 DUF3825 domain-containing protein [Pseudomonas aeruginosa]MBG7007585.1 DUF3825 domain-containing protein [Pseudomonas aeruginosa]MBG7023957.1 DUF3825 domain-containing protein [Pseudomonas aeruginosa]MBG7371968.1 DUF3825 domain-containing protein [Pseudomonas aeruginosa]MCG3027371.1 DUF3825 domain-containing protein [Pseudomonas aeruginosa]
MSRKDITVNDGAIGDRELNIEKLQADIGSGYTQKIVKRLHDFAYIPMPVLEEIKSNALSENWGKNLQALKKYLAVNVAWSVEQGRVTFGEDQFYLTAGSLQTRYGTPLYLVFMAGDEEGKAPWKLIKGGPHINAPSLPSAPEIPTGLQMPKGAEIVMQHDHMLKDNADRVEFLKDAPPVAQMCAISGAIQWSINRSLQLPYWYFGSMNYLVPLYLRDREDITAAPDLVAPIQITNDQILVRTVLEPHMPYSNARVGVKRHDQLPSWMLRTWNDHADVEANGEEQ